MYLRTISYKGLLACAIACLALLLSLEVQARTIRFFVVVAAGGSVDAMARIVGDKFGSLVDATVVVENKPGGGGNVASQTVAKSAPDGNALLVSANNHTLNPSLFKDPGYQIDDLIPIAELMRGPSVIVVPANSLYLSLDQLIKDAKARPGAIPIGAAGIGTPSHIAAEFFMLSADIKMEAIQYRGSGPSLGDLVGGQIPVASSSLVAAMPMIKAGKLRALAVTSAKRWPGAEQIPTAAEFGMPDYEHVTWIGLFAPKGTPEAMLKQYGLAVKQALSNPDVQRRVAGLGGEVGTLEGEAFKKFILEDYEEAVKIVKLSGMKAE
jgi:tripartite-type tricarboxylate transporter receptor subunit TctC